jgi:hypothetical protein
MSSNRNVGGARVVVPNGFGAIEVTVCNHLVAARL